MKLPGELAPKLWTLISIVSLLTYSVFVALALCDVIHWPLLRGLTTETHVLSGVTAGIAFLLFIYGVFAVNQKSPAMITIYANGMMMLLILALVTFSLDSRSFCMKLDPDPLTHVFGVRDTLAENKSRACVIERLPYAIIFTVIFAALSFESGQARLLAAVYKDRPAVLQGA